MLNAESVDGFMWGRRYLIVLFVRPIPRFAMADQICRRRAVPQHPEPRSLEKDPQLTDFTRSVGWAAAIGSAPGGVFDLWLEFWWGYLFAVFAVGWGLGLAYRRALSQGGFSLALYALMTALSIFFIMQGLEAFAFRALLLGAVMWLGWRYAIGGDALAHMARTARHTGNLPRTVASPTGTSGRRSLVRP